MSSQFSFFLGPNDQAAFEAALRQSGDITFAADISQNPSMKVCPSCTLPTPGKESFKVYIVRTVDIDCGKFRSIPARNEFTISENDAPVIEFCRFPFVVDNRLIRASRLYRHNQYWGEDGTKVRKSEDFITWADQLFKIAKKSLTKVEGGYYAGAEALELRKSGIGFEQIDVPYYSGVKKPV